MELFAEGTEILFVVPLKYGNPEDHLRRALTRVCGKNFVVLDPKQHRKDYEAALGRIRARLKKGENLICCDWETAQVSFFTPSREQKAWSAWIRIVDISASLYN